jgi:hypothetical protein
MDHTRKSSPTSSSPSLSLAQTMLLQGVIPIVLVGFVLPIGLIGLALALEEAPVSGAIDHGELFLSAANAGFIGCIALVASRTDEAINAMIAAIVVLVLVILPGYVGWALISVQGVLGRQYSNLWPIAMGGSWALIGTAVGLTLVRLSYRPPIKTRSPS